MSLIKMIHVCHVVMTMMSCHVGCHRVALETVDRKVGLVIEEILESWDPRDKSVKQDKLDPPYVVASHRHHPHTLTTLTLSQAS